MLVQDVMDRFDINYPDITVLQCRHAHWIYRAIEDRDLVECRSFFKNVDDQLAAAHRSLKQLHASTFTDVKPATNIFFPKQNLTAVKTQQFCPRAEFTQCPMV